MNRLTKTVLAAVLLAGTAGCSTTPTPDIRSQAAPGVPLASYRTFAWASTATPDGTPNPLVYQSARDALTASFKRAGLSEVALENADMIIGITLGARDKVDVTNWGPVAPYYPAYGRGYRYGWSYTYSDVEVRNVTEGSLALDVFDGETDRPVWHGVASDRLGSKGASDELISAAANGLVARFMADRAGGL